jgi:hypothetical protein
MTLYICIYNPEIKEIAFAEEYPIDTPDEQDWASKNSQRLANECICRLPEKWENYHSTDKQFEFAEE